MLIYASYAMFLGAAALLFATVSARTAICVTYFAGWVILPVGQFPAPVVHIGSPWSVIGSALPSDMLVTKAWVVAATPMFWGTLFHFDDLRRWRPGWIDVPMACWCIWPLVDGLFAVSPTPSPLIATLYVCGCWGLPWLLGRIWFGAASDRFVLLEALAWVGVALVPLAVIEGVASPIVYQALYGHHPFRTDGIERYIGYRPLGFFEDGNQYGIWVCVSALAAIWLRFGAARFGWRTGGGAVRSWAWVPVTAAAVAGQSVGALLLLIVGLAALAFRSRAFFRPLMLGSICAVALIGAVEISGVVPLQHIARATAVGRHVLGGMRAVGRGSLLWRVSQDTKVLATIHKAPLQGTAQWDWFRPYHTRPWGLAMLMIGQFGLIGVLLAFGSVLAPAVAVLARRAADQEYITQFAAAPLAVIVVLAMSDAVLNSFVYMPAILVAGAIARVAKNEAVTPGA